MGTLCFAVQMIIAWRRPSAVVKAIELLQAAYRHWERDRERGRDRDCCRVRYQGDSALQVWPARASWRSLSSATKANVLSKCGLTVRHSKYRVTKEETIVLVLFAIVLRVQCIGVSPHQTRPCRASVLSSAKVVVRPQELVVKPLIPPRKTESVLPLYRRRRTYSLIVCAGFVKLFCAVVWWWKRTDSPRV